MRQLSLSETAVKLCIRWSLSEAGVMERSAVLLALAIGEYPLRIYIGAVLLLCRAGSRAGIERCVVLLNSSDL